MPSPTFSLSELRMYRGYTKLKMASLLDVDRTRMSILERTLTLSTTSLRKYVSALGGQLVFLTMMNGESIQILPFTADAVRPDREPRSSSNDGEEAGMKLIDIHLLASAILDDGSKQELPLLTTKLRERYRAASMGVATLRELLRQLSLPLFVLARLEGLTFALKPDVAWIGQFLGDVVGDSLGAPTSLPSKAGVLVP